MKQTVNEHTFHRAFEQLRPDQFTYQGQNALFDYLTELEEGTGEEFELDKTIEDIEEQTTVIPVDGESFIIQQF